MEKVTSGWGRAKTTLWDTDWDLEAKKKQLLTLDEKKLFFVLEKLEGKAEKDEQLIQEQIQKGVSKSDTGGVAPTGKSPGAGVNIIHMNYATDHGGKRSDLQFGYLQFFAEQAASLGLKLEILTTAEGEKDCKAFLESIIDLSFNITVVDQVVSEWAEDSAEFLQSGQLGVLNKFSDSTLGKGMDKGRKERWGKDLYDKNQDDIVPKGMKVNAGDTDKVRKDKETDQGRPVAHLRAYLEGGNMITAEDTKGRPIILVGKDGIDGTAYVYQLSRIAVLELIAEDFGMKPEQIIPVEQPGKFHLDMGLLVVGMGKVLLNDSSEEYKKAKSTYEKMKFPATKKLLDQAELIYHLENMAEKDLTSAGFLVTRKKLESGSSHNFFNGEFVSSKGGKKYYITNGGPKEEKEEFWRLMVRELKVVEDVRFAPSNITFESLRQQGGVGCRIKGATIPLKDFGKVDDFDNDFEIVPMPKRVIKMSKETTTISIVNDTYAAIGDILKDGSYGDEKAINKGIELFKKEEPITTESKLILSLKKALPDAKERLLEEMKEYVMENYTS